MGPLVVLFAQAAASCMTYWRGRATEPVTSREYGVEPFDRAVISWNASGPAVFELKAGGAWHAMGRWGEKPESVFGPGVEVDTLVLASPAASFQFRATPAKGTVVSLVVVAHWKSGEKRPYGEKPSGAWGKTLDVPQRSQVIEKKDSGEICSPTSLSMVLEFHGFARPTREVADGCFDHAAGIYGNWSFNTAYAHRVSGLEAWVARFSGLEDLEEEISAGRPVVVSHRWKSGDLDGAPVRESNGHLIVVAGFTPSGDLVVNDPAARPGSVRMKYKRRQIYATWLEQGSGIAYLLRRPP